MFEILRLLNIPSDHPGAAIINLFRHGALVVEVRPGSLRHRQLCSLMAALATVATPVTPDGIEKWLAKIVRGTKPCTMTAREIEQRVDCIKFALEGKPSLLFCPEVQRAVLLREEWVPTAAAIWAVMEPYHRKFEALLKDFNRITGRMLLAPLPSAQELAALGADTPRRRRSRCRHKISSASFFSSTTRRRSEHFLHSLSRNTQQSAR